MLFREKKRYLCICRPPFIYETTGVHTSRCVLQLSGTFRFSRNYSCSKHIWPVFLLLRRLGFDNTHSWQQREYTHHVPPVASIRTPGPCVRDCTSSPVVKGNPGSFASALSSGRWGVTTSLPPSYPIQRNPRVRVWKVVRGRRRVRVSVPKYGGTISLAVQSQEPRVRVRGAMWFKL